MTAYHIMHCIILDFNILYYIVAYAIHMRKYCISIIKTFHTEYGLQLGLPRVSQHPYLAG